MWDDGTYQVEEDGDVLAADDSLPYDNGMPAPHRLRRQTLATPDSVDQYNLPIHHSKPSSTKKLFINFQGEVIHDTAWNNPSKDIQVNGGGYTPITVRPFYATTNVAGPITLSDAARDMATDVWMRVAEDFRPFDIDVTTERPVRALSLICNVDRCCCCDYQIELTCCSSSGGLPIDVWRRGIVQGLPKHCSSVNTRWKMNSK